MLALATLALPFAAGLLGVAQAQNTILVNSPAGVVFCQPTLLSWSGGNPPYYVKINEGGSVSATIVNLLSDTTLTSFTWTTDLTPGRAITLAVKDSLGYENYAAEAVVAPNPSGVTTCGSASPNVTTGPPAPSLNTAITRIASVPVLTTSGTASRASIPVVGTTSRASAPSSAARSGLSSILGPGGVSRASISTSRAAAAATSSRAPSTATKTNISLGALLLTGMFGLGIRAAL